MLKDIGAAALLTAFLASIYTVFAAARAFRLSARSEAEAARRHSIWLASARTGLQLQLPLLGVSVLALLLLILGDHFDNAYIYSVSSLDMPVYLKITALWGGQEGSLLFWSFCMSAFTAAAARRFSFNDRFQAAFFLVTAGILSFFLMVSTIFDNPFATLWQLVDGNTAAAFFHPRFALPISPANGQGMNPLLRHPGMLFHPPLQYLGFVSYVIPFSLAASALITGETQDSWARASRKWSLAAWLFLSLGLVLGMRWAYDVLGWGGYWGWDPVETAALMPWLTGTAFLHSIYIQEKRGMLRRWNYVLITLTFLLILFGTFISRSGVLSSVHAFASSTVGLLFFAFISIVLITVVILLYIRWDSLASENTVQSLASREVVFLLNNALFTGLVLVCFWGVLFPLISETFTGQKATVGPAYYESATGPLWALILLLMGIAPLTSFLRTAIRRLRRRMLIPGIGLLITLAGLLLGGIRSPGALAGFPLLAFTAIVTVTEIQAGIRFRMARGASLLHAAHQTITSSRRRYGGYLVHLGIILMAVGIIGIEVFQTDTQRTLSPGDRLEIGRYSIRFDGMTFSESPEGVQQRQADLTVSAGERILGTFSPRRDFYPDWQQTVTVPAVRSTLRDDLYIRLVNSSESGTEEATVKAYLNPLFNFLWIGTGVLILGTFAALGPLRERKSSLSHIRNTASRAALLLAVMLLSITTPSATAFAQDATPPPDDAVNAVAEQMYCPVCEGVPLDACETKACQQWREDIRERLARGWTNEQIKAYFVEQYGIQVLEAPPARGFSLLVYLVPAGGLLAGAVLLGKTIYTWTRSSRDEEGSQTSDNS